MRLWAAMSVSVFGDQISALAIPLAAVLTLDASAAQMGVLTALFWLPHLLFSLPVGVWVDARRVKRTVMIAADIGRAALLVSIPVAAAFDALSLLQLYFVVFLTGSCAVFFDLSYSSFFTATVPREHVLAANGRLSTSRAVAYVGRTFARGRARASPDGAHRNSRRLVLIHRVGVLPSRSAGGRTLPGVARC